MLPPHLSRTRLRRSRRSSRFARVFGRYDSILQIDELAVRRLIGFDTRGPQAEAKIASAYRAGVLVLTNTGEPAARFATDPSAINDAALIPAAEIWFTRGGGASLLCSRAYRTFSDPAD